MTWKKQGFDKHLTKKVETTKKVDDQEIHGKSIESRTFPVALTLYTTNKRDALSRPLKGLTIFNTTTGTINYYDGSEWQNILSSLFLKRYIYVMDP